MLGLGSGYDSPIYQVLSVEDEDEVDNFKVVRRVPFDRGKDLTVATEKQKHNWHSGVGSNNKHSNTETRT
jgi:hypothetical protein